MQQATSVQNEMQSRKLPSVEQGYSYLNIHKGTRYTDQRVMERNKMRSQKLYFKDKQRGIRSGIKEKAKAAPFKK